MDDLISRQAAIDFISAGHLCNPNEPRWSDNEVVNFLKSRPSAQPEWIPWKEYDRRLQDHYYYLVTHIDYGTPMKAKYHDDPPRFEIKGGQTADVYFESELITAWMPLPEPYKGEP